MAKIPSLPPSGIFTDAVTGFRRICEKTGAAPSGLLSTPRPAQGAGWWATRRAVSIDRQLPPRDIRDAIAAVVVDVRPHFPRLLAAVEKDDPNEAAKLRRRLELRGLIEQQITEKY
jgi:hypothetical protein